MQKFIYRHIFFLSLVWTILIFILCATPGQYIPSANWLELLSFDKFIHASIFFVLTSLWFLVALKYRQRTGAYVLYFLGAVGYGMLLEWMQAHWFSNRSADWKDIIANSFGCVIALVLLKRIRKFIKPDQGSAART